MLNYNASLIDFLASSLVAGLPASAILLTLQGKSIINCDYRRVGGLRFLKIGRLNFSFSVSRAYRPIGGTR